MRLHPKVLNLTANICLVGSICALGTAAWYRFSHRPEPPSRSALPFKSGDHAPKILGVDYASAERHFLVFVSTACHYCASSAPFYNRIHQTALASNEKLKFFAVFWESKDNVQAFKARVNLVAESLPSRDFRDFGVHSTPTAILVDHAGTIERVWYGASETVEGDIASTIGVQELGQSRE